MIAPFEVTAPAAEQPGSRQLRTRTIAAADFAFTGDTDPDRR